MKQVVLYATDTMADWEYGYLVAGLGMANQESERFRLIVASEGAGPVTTMGGLRVQADTDIAGLDVDAIDMLVLPGADSWGQGDAHGTVLALAAALIEAGRSVAAICGATLGLAGAGLLDDRPHTSNDAAFPAMAPSYAGAEHYVEQRSVDAGGVITAGAAFPIDFARTVFERLQAFPQPVIDAWYGLYTTGERRYFDVLMGGGGS